LRIVTAGKLIRLKGFPLALAAFHRLHKWQPTTTLEIVGDGPDREYLERLIRQWQLTDCVRLVPWQPRPALLEFLRRCDIFLFTSLRDGGGAVVVEALAAGKPVVCLDVAGPGLHVTEGCGLKVAVRDPAQVIEDLALALKRLHDDPPLRETMGRAARERAVADYRWDRFGERLAEVCQRAVERPLSSSTKEPLPASREVLHAPV